MVPDHWCLVPELGNLTVDERKRLSIPSQNGSFDRCSRYSVDWEQLLDEHGGDLEGIEANNSWIIETCLDGWEYNKSHVQSSVVIDVSF